MAILVQQSSTGTPLEFFMVQSADHITALTGATPTVTISKNGGAFASPSGAVSELANGWYQIAGNATDTGTLGAIKIHATAASGDPSDTMPYQVVPWPMSVLPNTACTTNASLLTSGTGTDQLSVSAGKTLLQATQAGVTIPTVTTVTNQLTAAAIATGVWQDTTAGDFTTASSIGKSLYTAGILPGGSGGLLISGSNSGTTTLGALTVTGATTMTGGLVGNITGNLSGSVGSVTGAVGSVTGSVGSVTGSVASVTGSVGSVTGAVGSVTAGVTVTTNNDKSGYVLSALGSAQLTESYAADGTAPTLNQAIFQIMQFLHERAAAGTTVTVKKLDGSTGAMTFTINDATTPTSITRTT